MITDVLYGAATFVLIFWPTACIINRAVMHYGLQLDNGRLAFLHWLINELKPFYLPAVVCRTTIYWVTGAFSWLAGFMLLMEIITWYVFRHDGDDRWKRRRVKAKEKIARVGAKLVVVPVPEPVPVPINR